MGIVNGYLLWEEFHFWQRNHQAMDRIQNSFLRGNYPRGHRRSIGTTLWEFVGYLLWAPAFVLSIHEENTR